MVGFCKDILDTPCTLSEIKTKKCRGHTGMVNILFNAGKNHIPPSQFTTVHYQRTSHKIERDGTHKHATLWTRPRPAHPWLTTNALNCRRTADFYK